MTARLEEPRDGIVTACRSLAATGLVRGIAGNVSLLDRATELVVASPSGTEYDTMTSQTWRL